MMGAKEPRFEYWNNVGSAQNAGQAQAANAPNAENAEASKGIATDVRNVKGMIWIVLALNQVIRPSCRQVHFEPLERRTLVTGTYPWSQRKRLYHLVTLGLNGIQSVWKL